MIVVVLVVLGASPQTPTGALPLGPAGGLLSPRPPDLNPLPRAFKPAYATALVSNCMKFLQLILRKINKAAATKCQILRLKCTNFDFGWGSTPDPAGGAYIASPGSLIGIEGPISKEGR